MDYFVFLMEHGCSRDFAFRNAVEVWEFYQSMEWPIISFHMLGDYVMVACKQGVCTYIRRQVRITYNIDYAF